MKTTKTDYQITWENYLSSTDYKRAEEAMIKKGIKQPYLNNILQGAFEAGWNLKKVV